ncbi:MAG: acyl-CoA desaturase [Opitutaceae bacterium]|nr:acyl-CoA desaturase [Opitutaceae bacterium]
MSDIASDVQPRGIILGGPAAWEKRFVNALLIGAPLVGTLYACHYFRSNAVSGIALIQFAGWYVISGVGIGIGFHRLFSHKSFQTYPAIKLLLGIAGSLAFQGSVVRWIADQRRHHRFTDQPPDTHTPHRFPLLARSWSRARNLWHAHVGWMFDASTTDPRVFAPDLLRDPIAVWLDRWYFALTALSWLLPYGVGFLVGGSEVAFQSILLGGCVRTAALHHVIWAVNSIGHTWGSRPSTRDDESRNNWVLAAFTFGEGWHNNHHAAPRSAYNNWRGYELDVNGAIIRLLERLHLVWSVNRHRKISSELP